jgi:PAS domain S-box-containing protein
MDHWKELDEALAAAQARAAAGEDPGEVRIEGAPPAVQAVVARLNEVLSRGAQAARERDEMRAEQGRRELLFQSIVEHLPVMLFLKDAAHLRMVAWNRVSEEITGVPGSAILGKGDHDFFPPEQAAEFVRRDRQTLASRQLVDVEEPITKPDGETRWLRTRKIPLVDDRGEPTHLLGISEDITERRLAERELREAKEAAEAASRAKSQFLANVSHELRTPLTLILGSLDAVLGGEIPAAHEERLRRARRNAARLAQLVNDLLDHARLEAGKAEAHWQRVDPNEALEYLVEEASALAEQRGISLHFRPAPGLPPLALDRRLFDKIALNLVGNALKFTPQGGTIQVALRRDEGHIELSVQDTGVGIATHELPRLFERFRQVDSTATRQHEGTGIGLSLVREFARLMGGEASVESQIGEGSTFRVHLPLRPATALDHEGHEAPGRAPKAKESVRARPAAPLADEADEKLRPRLLLAEDNADLRAHVAELLAGEYEVLGVENGRLALEAVRMFQPEVIVSDIMMPEMDGITLVGRLKADPATSSIPVILLTAQAGPEAAVTGLDGGADDYLSKPFSAVELRARIRASVRLHRAYRALELTTSELRETRGLLIEFEKLAFAGRLMRAVDRALTAPLQGVRRSLREAQEQAATRRLPDQERLLEQSGRVLLTLERTLSELALASAPPPASLPEMVDLVQLLRESLETQLEASLWSLEGPGQVEVMMPRPDLRAALDHVVGFLVSHQGARPPGQPVIEAVVQSGVRPALRLASRWLDLPPGELTDPFDPRFDGERLDLSLATAHQLLTRNGVLLEATPLGEGLQIQMRY